MPSRACGFVPGVYTPGCPVPGGGSFRMTGNRKSNFSWYSHSLSEAETWARLVLYAIPCSNFKTQATSYCGSAGVWALHEVPAHSGTQVLSGAETKVEQGKNTLTEVRLRFQSRPFCYNHTSFRVLPCFLGFSLVSFETHLCHVKKKDSRFQEGKYNHISQNYLILKATTKLTAASAEVILL